MSFGEVSLFTRPAEQVLMELDTPLVPEEDDLVQLPGLHLALWRSWDAARNALVADAVGYSGRPMYWSSATIRRP